MAFSATLEREYTTAVSRAAELKRQAADHKAAMAAGNVSANVIQQILLRAIEVKAANQLSTAVPGIGDYAKAQSGDPSYDVAAEWLAMNTAIDALGANILATIPTANSGGTDYVLVEEWTATGINTRTFTPAQTATIQSLLQSLVDTID